MVDEDQIFYDVFLCKTIDRIQRGCTLFFFYMTVLFFLGNAHADHMFHFA